MNKIFGIIIFTLVLVSCGTDKNRNNETNKLEKVSKEIILKYAERFTIIDNGDYMVLQVFPMEGETQNYILYRNAKPQITISPSTYIKIPVKKVASLSSLYVGFSDRLGVVDDIVAVDNIDYISNKTVENAVKSGGVTELAKGGNLNEELCMALHPDVVITYGTGPSDIENNKKLKNAGIPFVYCLDNRENTPLGRAEWMKFVACFYDKLHEADSLFNETERNYDAIRDSAVMATVVPSVFTETKLNDAWYVPGGKSYMAALIKDANASYCWVNDSNTVSLPLSFEQVYKKCSEADFWINLGFCNTKNDLLLQDSRYANFKAFQSGNLYNYNKRSTPAGGNEFWETGLIMPDRILKDLVKIFHPSFYRTEEFTYYRKLDE